MNYVKNILLVGLGVAAGFASGYFYAKKKIEDEKDNEIQEVRNYYYRKIQENDKDIEKLNEQMSEIDEAIDAYQEKTEHPKEEKKKKTSKKTDYHKLGAKEKEEVVKAEAESPEEEDSNKPYLITEDEFLNDKNEYDKISLTYYMEDETLTDECDEPVDVEETVSSDIYNQFKELTGDIYIRNNILQTDFEIMKVESTYDSGYGSY